MVLASTPVAGRKDIALFDVEADGSVGPLRLYGAGEGDAVAVRGEHVALAGATRDTIDFGEGPLVGDDWDLFVAQISPWRQ